MLVLIVKVLLSILVILVVAIAAREVRAFFNMSYYVKQGAVRIYNPIIGYLSLYTKKSKLYGNFNQKIILDHIQQYRGTCKMLVMHNHDTPRSVVIPICPKLINEIFLKELDYTKKRVTFEGLKVDHSLFQRSDETAMLRVQSLSRFYSKANMGEYCQL